MAVIARRCTDHGSGLGRVRWVERGGTNGRLAAQRPPGPHPLERDAGLHYALAPEPRILA
jgi:hypothetical protein